MENAPLPTVAEIRACTSFLSSEGSINTVAKLSDTLVAKYGPQVVLEEPRAMQFVSNHTDVPVPKIHAILTDEETKANFFIMDLMPGQTLEKLMPFLTADEKADIAQQIKAALAELRSVADPGYLGSVDKAICTHAMFWATNDGTLDPLMSGPFDDEAAFNEGLLRKLATMPNMPPAYLELLRNLFAAAYTGHKKVVTHGDLQPKNIMVHRQGTWEDGPGDFTVSIIDWETSGWYPEYWEYCVARHRRQHETRLAGYGEQIHAYVWL